MEPRAIKNGNADDLLGELKTTKSKKQGSGIQNASADDLLNEAGISKKKSSSPESVDGGKESSTSQAQPSDGTDFMTGTHYGNLFEQMWGGPTKVMVGDKEVDMTKLVPSPLIGVGRTKAGQELARKVLTRNISDNDAALISTQTGQSIEEIKTAINKPQTYNLQKSQKILNDDFDNSFAAIYNTPLISDIFKRIEPQKLKQMVTSGNTEVLNNYYQARKEDLSKKIADVQTQLTNMTSMRGPEGGVVQRNDYDPKVAENLKNLLTSYQGQLANLTTAVDQVHTSSLNKQFDVPDRHTVVDFDTKKAEELGMKKVQLLNPVAYSNMQAKLRAGYSLDERTRFNLAQAGYDMRAQALAMKFENAEADARPVLETRKLIVDNLDKSTKEVKDAEEKMNSNRTKANVDNYRKAYANYQQAFESLKQVQKNPLVGQYENSYNELKTLVDNNPKLSDQFPEVRREELTRALHQAYANMVSARNMERANPILHPIGKYAGVTQNLLGYIFNESPGQKDYEALAKQFNMTVPEVKKLAVGNLMGDYGYSDEQLKKGAEAANMSVEEFSQLSVKDSRFQNQLLSRKIAAAMGVTPKDLLEMKSGMENIEGYKDNKLRLDGLLSAVSQGAYKTFRGFEKSYNRYFGEGTDQQISYKNELIDKAIAEYTRKPDEENLFGGATKIDLRKKVDGKDNPTYLREIINEKAGEFNLTPRSLVETIGDTIGQMSVFAGTAGIIGRGTGIAAKTLSNATIGAEELAAFKNAQTIADMTQRGTRFGELFGTVASGYAMSYDDHYRNAMQYTNDENKRHQSAMTNAFIEGMSELILPDIDVARAIRGDKSLFSIFNKIITKDGGALTKAGLKEYAGAIFKTLGIANKEGLEEVIVEPMQAISDKAILDKDIDWNQVATNAKQAYVTAFIGTIPTAVGGGIGGTSRLKKESLFEAGNLPTTYISGVQDLLAEGKISPQDANARIQTINTMADIVKHLPKEDGNGRPYTVDQKVELAAQEFRIRKNNNIIEKSKIDAVVGQAEADSKSAREIQEQILNQADQPDGDTDTVDELREKVASITNKNKTDEKRTGEESLQSAHNGSENQTNEQPGIEKPGQVDGGGEGQQEVLNPESNTDAEAGAGITLTEKNDLLLKAKYALPEVKNPIYRQVFKENMELALKEAAQQLNNAEPSAAETARRIYGPTISEIALKLFPGEKSPSAMGEDVTNEDDLLPEKQKNKLKGLRDDDFARKYFTEEEYKKWSAAEIDDPALAKKMISDKKEQVNKPAPKNELADLEKQYNETALDDLVALKKKLYPNPDIESAMSKEEKLLDSVIAKKFSEVNKKVMEKREQSKQGASTPADVSYVPIKDVNTDVERFQPRGTDFSPESVNKIVENFDENKLDPVVLYNDNGKTYVLAGHSRLEAHKTLDALPDTDPRKQKAIASGFQPGNIKARYFKGTEAEAVEFADRSNDLGTKNKVYESANSLRKMREKGASKSASMQRAQTDFGKDGRFIYMLSFLNPDGKLMQTLKGFDKNEDVAVKGSFEKMGQWIGSVREKLGDLISNAHENEMMDYLMDNQKSKKFTREAEFLQFINNIVGTIDYDSEQPLNLKRLKADNPAQIRYDNELDGLTQEIKIKQTEYDNINDRLNNPSNPDYINPDEEDYDEILGVAENKKNRLNTELVAMRRQLADLKLDKGKILKQGLGQMGLFESSNLTKGETQRLDEELIDDGITVNDIENYEKNISDTGEVQESGDGNAEQTGAVQESVSEPDNEQIGSEKQDTGSTELPTEKPASTTDPLKLKQEKLAKLKKEFFKELRGKLNIGLDPTLIAKGLELIAAYADIGIYKFGEIMKDAVETFGEKSKDLLDAMKAAYGSYLTQTDNEELDDIKTVRAFTLDDIPGGEVTEEAPVSEIPEEQMSENELQDKRVRDKLYAAVYNNPKFNDLPTDQQQLLREVEPEATLKASVREASRHNLLLWQYRGSLNVSMGSLVEGKYPNGQKLDVKKEIQEIRNLADAIKYYLTDTTPPAAMTPVPVANEAQPSVTQTDLFASPQESKYKIENTGYPVPAAVATGAENLLSALNIGRKGKEVFGQLEFLSKENNGLYLIAARTAENEQTVFNIVNENGEVPANFPTNWRGLKMAIADMYPPESVERTEITDLDEDVNPAMTDEDHILENIRTAEDQDDKEYWEKELVTLRTKPFEYWKGIYNAFTEDDKNEDRVQESFAHLKEFVTANPSFTWDDVNAGPIYQVKEFDMNDGVELASDRGTLNIPLQQFLDDMQPVEPVEFNEPVIQTSKPNHPIVKGLLDQVKDMTAEDAHMEIERFVFQQLSGDRNKRLRQDIYSSLTGKKQTVANSGVTNINNEIKNLYDATSTASNLESNSSRTGTQDGLGKEIFSDERGDDRPGDTGTGNEVIGTVPIEGSPGILPFDATVEREPSDSGLSEYERNERPEQGTTGPAGSGGSGLLDDGGIQSDNEGAADVKDFITDGSERSFEDKLIDQKNAEPIPVIPLDKANIAATLPLLKPGQLEDVWKAENRFINHNNNEDLMYGKGILFTNGTGTGKTLLGLGIAKRMAKQGKDQVTIVVPTDKKAKDWIEEGGWMGLDIQQLENTKSAPKGMLVTTYANMAQNPLLQERPNDLVIYDESHKLNSNQAGDFTSNQEGHYNMSLSPNKARRKAKEEINYETRLSKLQGRDKPDIPVWERNVDYEGIKALEAELDKKVKEVFDRTKVIFLSATPFAYHPSLTYADGYLYSIIQKLKPDNQQDSYRNFYISNFGYRVRYNKLTKPESGVDVDLLERQFTENLKNKGVISSRKLDIPVDYSRQFALVDNEIGMMIDDGMKAASNRDIYKQLPYIVGKRMNFIYTNQLMEALKARWAVDRVKKHLALGRKVVVSHSYIENYPAHPFDFNDTNLWGGIENVKELRQEIQHFEENYPQYRNLNLSGLKSPIETIKQAFGDKVVMFNGRVPKKERGNNVKLFNDDRSGKDIIMVQMEAGKEGISLHDKTGKFQRAEINLGLPYKPTDSIQIEGRVYRTGQKTDAVVEYPILNTNFERYAYASKINERVRTAENLAMGEEARNMEVAFKEGYVNATADEPSLEQGKGGKAEDSRMDKTSEFDKSKTYYYKRGKRTAAQKRGVENDYYATPEPLGYKMVQWLNWVSNEKLLEPSAGHGAIARFMSKATNNIFIEPNTTLRSEIGLNAIGDPRGGTFEDLNVINKFDGIAMNPPFGHAGKTAMDHLEKATTHLRDGGRIVALVPVGQFDKRFDKWYENEDNKNFYVRARVLLPNVVFERAGTNVATQIIVLDRIDDQEKAKGMYNQSTIDLRGYDEMKDFFDTIEDMELPDRLMPGRYAEETTSSSDERQTSLAVSNNFEVPEGENADDILQVVKNFHSKKGVDIYVAKVVKQLSRDDFDNVRAEAKKLGGYYSSFKGNGAIPGFVFDDQESAEKLAALANGKGMPETKGMSMADRIRTLKLGKNFGPNLYSTILPVPQIWNAAVELVALAVEGGTALADALRKGADYIRMNYDEHWQKDKYNEYMIDELKKRGTMNYNLSDAQRREAGKVLSRLKRGANIINEMNKIRAVFDNAKAKLSDPVDIADLEDANKEFERYLFDSMSIHQIENATNDLDLGLKGQTWWQKQKENLQNRYQRLEQTQKAVTDAGITIEERNDVVNAADRWKSIAEAKIDKILHGIGLADTDVFIWKGRKKVADSLFDRMSEKNTGIPDFYRRFGLYLYAKHAPERNAHNATQRREKLAEKIAITESDLADLEAQYILQPSSTLQGLITKKKNELELYNEYRDMYSDPNSNKNYVNLLEKRIRPDLRLMDDGGSGMTNEQASDIIQAVMDEGHYDKFQEFETEVREKIVDKILENQLEYGLIPQEDYDFLSSYYTNYVPLKVDDKYFEDEKTFTDSKIPGAKIYKSKGANYIDFENRINPLTQAIIDLQATIYNGEQNNYKKTISNAITSAPDEKVWQMRAATFVPVKDKNGRILKMNEVDVPANGIPYVEDGQKKYLVINDEALKKELTEENVKAAIPVLAKINGFFRAINTVYNPNFTVSNLFRDMETAGIVLSTTEKAEVKKFFAGNVKKVFSIIAGSYREQSGDEVKGYWSQLAREYKDLGGNMSWFHQDTREGLINDIEGAYDKYNKSGVFENGKNLALAVSEFMNRSNQAIETSTRLAMYDALLKAGTPKYKAVEIARNATINFNKKGNWSGITDSLYLFANASIQGSTNVLKTMLTTKRGLYMAGGIVVMGMLQSFIANFFSDCDTDPADCYDNIPGYEKDRNIMIPTGHGYIKIPLAYGFNVFYNMGEKLAQAMQGKQSWQSVATGTLSSGLNAFNPAGNSDTPVLQQISPTATDPFVQWFTNRDGLGRKIYEDNDFVHKPDSEQGFGSPKAQDLARWMNSTTGGNEKIKGKIDVSPGTLDWIYQTGLGGLGQFVKQGVNTIFPDKSYSQIEPKEIPIVNRFYTIPFEKADKAAVYEIKDRSYNNVLSPSEMKTFNDEVDKAVRLKQLTPDKASDYKNAVNKNQFELTNPGIVGRIDQSKTRIMEEDEIDSIKEELEQMYEDGKIPENWLKGYKAEITRNQNKLKPKEEE